MKIDIVKIKAFAIPMGLFVASVVLYVVGGRILIDQIKATREKIARLEKETSVFEEKVSILQDFSATSSNYINIVSTALPDQNAGITFISQIKRGTQLVPVVISNINAGSPLAEEELSKAQINFDVDGSLAEVMNFVQYVSRVSPLSRIEKIRINQTATAARATVTASVFWASFPEKLPDITQPIDQLSADEQTMLADLAKRVQPVFLRFTPTVTTPRADPFNL